MNGYSLLWTYTGLAYLAVNIVGSLSAWTVIEQSSKFWRNESDHLPSSLLSSLLMGAMMSLSRSVAFAVGYTSGMLQAKFGVALDYQKRLRPVIMSLSLVVSYLFFLPIFLCLCGYDVYLRIKYRNI